MGYEYVTNDRATTRALGSHKERNKSFMTRLAVTLKLVKGRGVQMSHVVAYCWSTQGTNGVVSVSLVGFLTHMHKHQQENREQNKTKQTNQKTETDGHQRTP